MTKRKLHGRQISGKKGGTRTKKLYGTAHYKKIGKLGGKVSKKRSPKRS